MRTIWVSMDLKKSIDNRYSPEQVREYLSKIFSATEVAEMIALGVYVFKGVEHVAVAVPSEKVQAEIDARESNIPERFLALVGKGKFSDWTVFDETFQAFIGNVLIAIERGEPVNQRVVDMAAYHGRPLADLIGAIDGRAM